MKTKILVFLLIVLFFQLASKPVLADKLVEVEVEARKLDPKAKILAAYFAKFNSPLQNHAQDFIDASETYKLDWRLVPAIAGVESTFGKQIPGGYNAWGWGVYGTQAIYFDSWRDGIFTVSKGLRENYFNKGLTEPYAINRVYAASTHWAGGVSYFMQDLEKFANQFETDQRQTAQIGTSPSIAAISGQLALR